MFAASELVKDGCACYVQTRDSAALVTDDQVVDMVPDRNFFRTPVSADPTAASKEIQKSIVKQAKANSDRARAEQTEH